MPVITDREMPKAWNGSEVTKNPTNGGKPCPMTLIETQGESRLLKLKVFWRP